MAYCSQSNLLDQISEDDLIQLTDDDDTGAVDTDVVDQAIADADAEINSYCGVRHSVPFSTVPPMVLKLSVDITIYNLYSRRRGAPDERKERYDNAIRYLKDVAKGLVTLGEDDPESTPSESSSPDISSNTRIFSRDTMEGF